MTALSFKASKILSDSNTRGVFEAVAEPRTISVRELRKSFPKVNLEQSIESLKALDLIAEKPAIIGDFSTLYVTANGLNVAQVLRSSILI